MCAVPVDPVFIDLETRSSCDLRAEGGYRYADHPDTRLLTVAWTADMGATYHVWFPGADRESADEVKRAVFDKQVALQIPGVVAHWKGDGVPEELAAVAHRPWIGHNAWTFDRQVWARLGNPQPPFWGDTYPLALAAGLPGGLDAIGKLLWGEGKYEAGAKLTREVSRSKGLIQITHDSKGRKLLKPRVLDDREPENVPVVQQIMVARYNVQDVRLLVQLWPVLIAEARLNDHERRVLKAHDSCNSRGVRIDRPFVQALITLTNEAAGHATKQIAEMTKDHKNKLVTDTDLRSRTKMFAWLDEMGVKLGSSLRRELVTRFIEENQTDEPETDEAEDAGPEEDNGAWCNLPTVVKVLELRMQALRVTGGKLTAALQRTSEDGRLRGWAAYWAAHTGRWAGRGLQPHNMPRPKEGIDTWELASLYELHRRLPYDEVRAKLPIGARGENGKLLYPYMSVDDASSAMLRMMIVPDEGKVLAAADLANIEARVLAWLAGEKWLLKAFWDGADPYTAMAGRIFGAADTWPVFKDPKTGKPLPQKKHPYRQVGKVVVLGSGYQLGVDRFASYAASNGIDLAAVGTTPEACIIGFRRMHPAIAGEEHSHNGIVYFRGGYWDRLNDAAVAAVENGGPVPVGPVVFSMRGSHLIVTLPSGRHLVYRNARVAEVQFHQRRVKQVMYVSSRFGLVSSYGGKWAENIVQAVSRDILAHGFVLLEDTGFTPVNLHVHDELASSIDPDEGQMHVFMRCVTTPPTWLTKFPLDAEGSWAPRYAKSPDRAWKERFKDEWVYRNGERHK